VRRRAARWSNDLIFDSVRARAAQSLDADHLARDQARAAFPTVAAASRRSWSSSGARTPGSPVAGRRRTRRRPPTLARDHVDPARGGARDIMKLPLRPHRCIGTQLELIPCRGPGDHDECHFNTRRSVSHPIENQKLMRAGEITAVATSDPIHEDALYIAEPTRHVGRPARTAMPVSRSCASRSGQLLQEEGNRDPIVVAAREDVLKVKTSRPQTTSARSARLLFPGPARRHPRVSRGPYLRRMPLKQLR